MSTFLTDTFSGTTGLTLTSHTGEVGATWALLTGYTGSATVSTGNRIRSGTVAASVYYSSGLPASADYEVTADLVTVTNASTAGVAGRIDPAANTLYYAVFINGTGWQLGKVVAGSVTALATDGTTDGTALSAGSVPLKLLMVGSSISLIRNGVTLLGPITDTSITAAGRAGLRFVGNAGNGSGYHLDNLNGADVTSSPTLFPASLLFMM